MSETKGKGEWRWGKPDGARKEHAWRDSDESVCGRWTGRPALPVGPPPRVYACGLCAIVVGPPFGQFCDFCDGCGWYEGGPTLKTRCPECGGTGRVLASRGWRTHE